MCHPLHDVAERGIIEVGIFERAIGRACLGGRPIEHPVLKGRKRVDVVAAFSVFSAVSAALGQEISNPCSGVPSEARDMADDRIVERERTLLCRDQNGERGHRLRERRKRVDRVDLHRGGGLTVLPTEGFMQVNLALAEDQQLSTHELSALDPRREVLP